MKKPALGYLMLFLRCWYCKNFKLPNGKTRARKDLRIIQQPKKEQLRFGGIWQLGCQMVLFSDQKSQFG
jgi:hypothetical protein